MTYHELLREEETNSKGKGKRAKFPQRTQSKATVGTEGDRQPESLRE